MTGHCVAVSDGGYGSERFSPVMLSLSGVHSTNPGCPGAGLPAYS